MKTLLHNDFVIAAARIALGVIFVFASINKIADPNAFAASIAHYKLVGHQTGLLLATVIPWLELISGMCLIFGIILRGSSLLVFIMMVVFTGGVISGLVRGLDISCGCFSQDPEVGKIGWLKLLENLGLIALSWFLLISKADKFTFDHTHSSS
jgi:cobalt-zinc-cadmium efflux system protein